MSRKQQHYHQSTPHMNTRKPQIHNLSTRYLFVKQNSFNEITQYNGHSVKRQILHRGLGKGGSFENLGVMGQIGQPPVRIVDKKYTKTVHTRVLNKTHFETQNDFENNTSIQKNNENRNNSLTNNKNSTKLSTTQSTIKNNGNKRINLNIVLPQTIRAVTESEIVSSDIESSSEGTTDTIKISKVKIKAGKYMEDVPLTNKVETSNNVVTTNNIIQQQQQSTAPPQQQRPPLVRAMSAPVRSIHENNGKNLLVNNKRKSRRRKIPLSNAVEDNHESSIANVEGYNSQKLYTRSRSVVSSDVETLVSLLSSDGSESEKEDIPAIGTSAEIYANRPGRRAPLLKKTGKSVSFQETSAYQFNTKEYSHLLRRGSIIPLAARIRNNRPPTAPAGSIFLREFSQASNKPLKPDVTVTESVIPQLDQEHQDNTEYNYPTYVCSLKERECWKLHQKMCKKGINVAFETVLRGMLTPTEFRQSQKQKEIADLKAQALEDINNDLNNSCENSKMSPCTIVDRITEALLKK